MSRQEFALHMGAFQNATSAALQHLDHCPCSFVLFSVRLPAASHRAGKLCRLGLRCRRALACAVPVRCCQQHCSVWKTARAASIYEVRLALGHPQNLVTAAARASHYCRWVMGQSHHTGPYTAGCL